MTHSSCTRSRGFASGSIPSVACLFLVSALVLGGCRFAHPAPTAAPGGSTGNLPEAATLPDSYIWQKALFRGRQLVQVGPRRLPLPLTFPPGLTPLGGKALVETWPKPNPKGFALVMFYPSAQETHLHAWLSAFPKGFPLPAGRYRISSGPHNFAGRNGFWDSHTSVDTDFGRVYIVGHSWSSLHGEDGQSTDRDILRMQQAYEAPESPIPQAGRFESLEITFARPHGEGSAATSPGQR